MKIKDLNNTIINAMIQTGTVIDCKEGYMDITQQNLSEPTLTISVPSTVTVGSPTTITVTASVVGDITVYINQKYYQTSIGQSTMSFTYTPQDTFTIEAYFSSTQGVSVNASQEIVLIDFTPAVQSFNPLGDNYNNVFQEWLYNNGYSANAEYTTMEEALNLTVLPDRAFYNNTSLTHMDELQYFTNLTIIGEETFYGCTGLTSVVIPDSVISIGETAFRVCTGLTSIVIPDSVTSIGRYAFADCTGLTSVTIPNSVTSIGNYAFWGCTGLTSVVIPDSVTSIGWSAFSDCTGLTNITIPNSVTSIEYMTFSKCTGLTNITIPNSVTSIGDYVFRDCTGLTDVIISSGVTEIDYGAFLNCTSLYRIYCYATTPPYLWQGVETVFQNVPRIATLYVPQGSGNAYRNAGEWGEFNIEEMTVTPDSWAIQSTNPAGDKYNPSLQVWAKANGYSAENDYTTKTEAQAVTMIEANAFNNNTNLTSINELQYFTNLSIINDYAFRGTTNLTTGILPPSVADIYVGAFQNSGIQALNPRIPYDSTDYTKGASNVTASNVSRYAFAGSNLTSVTFGSNTTTVGASAFEGCLSLRNVYGEDSGWISVQNNTFKNCSMLKNIYLPSTVTMLLNNVVDGCTALEAIWCYATTPPSVTASTFTNMAADVTLYVPYESLSAYQSSSWANYFSSILPISAPQTYAVQSTDPSGANYNPAFQQYLYEVEGVSTNAEYTTTEEAEVVTSFINQMTAEQIQSITSLDELENFINLRTLPTNWLINNVSGVATVYAKRLQSVKFPESLTTIGFTAFASSSLTSVNLPQSLINVNGAFSICPLTNINIPASLTDSIGFIGYSVYGFYELMSFDYETIEPTLVSVNNSNNTYTINDGVLYKDNVPTSIYASTHIVNIPNNVDMTDVSVLSGYAIYKGIQQFTCSDANNSIYCTDGVVFRKDSNDLILFPTDYQSNTYTPPIECSAIGRVNRTVYIEVNRLIIESNILNVNFHHKGDTLELNSNIYSPQGTNNYIQTEAQTIIIGNNVTSIPVYFNSDTDIAPRIIDCYCYAVTPPTIYSYTFRISNSSTLYVSSESVTAYQNSDWANYFDNILSM